MHVLHPKRNEHLRADKGDQTKVKQRGITLDPAERARRSMGHRVADTLEPLHHITTGQIHLHHCMHKIH